MLEAAEVGIPSAARVKELRAEAQQLAREAPADLVAPHFLERLASAEDALGSPDKSRWWADATSAAATGHPPSANAVQIIAASTSAAEETRDGFLERLAKYIPAESITLTTLAFAALTPTGSDVWWLVAGGAVANILYLFATALQARKSTPMPRWQFYPLSAAALVLWSIAIIGIVGKEAGIAGSDSDTQKTFVLAVAAFFIPILDTIISSLQDMTRERKESKH